jgi:hypothetical protein
MIHHVTGVKIVKSRLRRGVFAEKGTACGLPGLRQIILR